MLGNEVPGDLPERFQVFISYRQSACSEIASKLYYQLIEAKIVVFWDAKSIPKGAFWMDVFQKALNSSRMIIPLISQTTMNSFKDDTTADNVLFEWDRALTLHLEKKTVIFPVFVFEEGQTSFNFSDVKVFDSIAEGCTRSSKQIWDLLRQINGQFMPSTEDNIIRLLVYDIVDRLKTLKFPSSPLHGRTYGLSERANPPIFINRDDIFSKIKSRLQIGEQDSNYSEPTHSSSLYLPKLCILKGVGGAGKTFIGTKFAFERASMGDLVVWLKCDSQANVKSGVIELAKWLGNLVKSEISFADFENYQLSLDFIASTIQQSTVNAMFILDNVEMFSDVRALVCSIKQTSFIITTREDLLDDAVILEKVIVVYPDEKSCAEYIQRYLNYHISLEDANKIYQRCGGVPLRLAISAAYLSKVSGFEETRQSFAANLLAKKVEDYDANTEFERNIFYEKKIADALARHKKLIETAQARCAKGSHPEIVITLDLLRERYPSSFMILRLCAELDPDVISYQTLIDFCQSEKKIYRIYLSPSVLEIDLTGNEFAHLEEFGLIILVGKVHSDSIFSVHRCIQAQLKSIVTADQHFAKQANRVRKFYTDSMRDKRKLQVFVELGEAVLQNGRNNSQNMEESYQRAAVWFHKAAKHPNAIPYLFIMYYGGLGVTRNLSSARDYLNKLDQFRTSAWQRILKNGIPIHCISNSKKDVFLNDLRSISKDFVTDLVVRMRDDYFKDLRLPVTIKTSFLDLNSSQIRDSDVYLIASALKFNSTLQTLYLSDNQIGDPGASAIAKALESNSRLQELNLWANQIGDTGATALAKALESNSILRTLSLSYNQIGDTGASALEKALQLNSTLQVLNLWGNKIGTEAKAELRKHSNRVEL